MSKCQDFQAENSPDQFEDDAEDQDGIFMDQSRGVPLPTYDMLFSGLKNLTMTVPRMHQIEGFRLQVGTPISPNFLIQHEFNLTGEAKPLTQQMMMMGMGSTKTPFY